MKGFTFTIIALTSAALDGLNGAHAYGPGLIDSLVQEYRDAQQTGAISGAENEGAATDGPTRALLTVRKNRPLLEILTLQQAEQAELLQHKHKKKDHKKDHTHKKDNPSPPPPPPPRPPTCPNVTPGTCRINAPGYSHLAAADPGACCQACKADPKCVAWGFNAAPGTVKPCHLKDAVGTPQPGVHCTSGVVRPPPPGTLPQLPNCDFSFTLGGTLYNRAPDGPLVKTWAFSTIGGGGNQRQRWTQPGTGFYVQCGMSPGGQSGARRWSLSFGGGQSAAPLTTACTIDSLIVILNTFLLSFPSGRPRTFIRALAAGYQSRRRTH